jgi:8-oxo-dGTP pyrophosphatase MutT (NUDIX family)
MTTTPATLLQAAAVPVRRGQVCVVTSRNGKRWVIPKGCLEPGKTASEIALQESWEEAGLVGVLHPDPVGSYLYDKGGLTCHVLVFLLDVTQVCDHWPEGAFRERVWLSPAQAAARVEDRGLCEILRGVLLARVSPSRPPVGVLPGLEGGADEYPTKPVDPEELRARVPVAWRLMAPQTGLAERARQLEAAPRVREVVGEEHPGVRQTLRLCVVALTETLALSGVPRHLRIALRTCRGLCREALGEPTAENGGAASPR